jgi:hypothetical protein
MKCLSCRLNPKICRKLARKSTRFFEMSIGLTYRTELLDFKSERFRNKRGILILMSKNDSPRASAGDHV